jgi:Ser/Thr protein kinase RdoA (MazF antagonist)
MRTVDTSEAIRAAAELACVHFGLSDLDIHLVSASENLTFRVLEGSTRATYSLRLHRPGYHDAVEMTSERQWLRALAAAGVRVPEPVDSAEGEEFVVVPVDGEVEGRFATMSRWMPGRILASLLDDDVEPAVEVSYWHQIGATMAAIHAQSSGWVAPQGFRRRHLDTPGLLGDYPHWGRFWEFHDFKPQDRRLLLAARDAIAELLWSYGCHERTYSLIHADMTIRNVLVDDQGTVSVIDFDDAAYGWHQYDMAAALNNCSNPIDGERERAFLDGYRSVRTLSDDDEALLPVFRLVRGMASLGWKGQRPEVEWPVGRLPALRRDVLQHARMFLDGRL